MFETTNQIKICIKNCIIRSHSVCHEMHRRCLPSFSKVSSLRLLRIDGHINLPIAKLFKDIHDAFLTLPKRNVAATRNMNSQDTSLKKKEVLKNPANGCGWKSHVHTCPKGLTPINHMYRKINSKLCRLNHLNPPKSQYWIYCLRHLGTFWDIWGHRIYQIPSTSIHHQRAAFILSLVKINSPSKVSPVVNTSRR